MRAPKNEATGTSGESEVLAEFERLGWAGLIDSRHDTGTDLYLRPRDARRYELGALMGAQVKTGPSYFASPQKNSAGEITGWWYAEPDSRHFEYWLQHALPHVMILRDQDRNLSYWVHVTTGYVIWTGKGAKILVPASQVVDDNHNDALADVALTQLATRNWDGTAWTGAVHLSPTAEIRHALVTPRLIAPHPNLWPDSITGLEALAMQVLLRSELEQTLKPMTTPVAARGPDAKWRGLSLDEARESGDWCWCATCALHLWHHEGQAAELFKLIEHSSNAAERAAAAILSCTILFGKNDPDAAIEVLHDALLHDDYSPVDHAWLGAQRARALLEVGKDEEAFDLAMKTQRIQREAPSDVTAAAIAGACALTSFRAAGWMQGDIANIIKRRDNSASWWTTQLMSYGLSAHLSEEFRKWSEDTSIRIGGADSAHRGLLSAALVYSCAGDQDGWRGATGALAEHLIVSTDPTSDPEAVAHWLGLLRLAGDSKGTVRATRRVVAKGPIVAARLAAASVDLSRSTRTTALADIEFLTAVGDTLEQRQADEICAWALSTLQDPQDYLERTRPTFFVYQKIIDLFRSLVWASSEEVLHRVLDYFLDQPPVSDDHIAQPLARLIRAIPTSAWQKSDRQRAATRSMSDAAYLREAFLAVAAPVVPESREEILRAARAGELIAFDAIDDIRTLPSDAAEALAHRLCGAIEILIGEASRGIHSMGGLDLGAALTLLNIRHPSSALWDPIEALLASRGVRPEQQAGMLQILAEHGASLALSVRAHLADLILALRDADRVEDFSFFGRDQNIRSVTAEALAALVDEHSRELQLRELLAGDTAHRVACARILERFGDSAESEVLLALYGDGSEPVRNAALSGLSKLLIVGRAPRGTEGILSRVLDSGGKRSAGAVVSRLQKVSAVPATTELLKLAAQHPSAQIRNAALEKIAS